MSLDVYLYMPKTETPLNPIRDAIFIREDGQTKEITREEWDERFPGREPTVVRVGGTDKDEDECVFDYNITHNLGKMADLAGVYKALWRPEEIDVTHAFQLISLLEQGLKFLIENEIECQKVAPSNGWGTYPGLVRFVTEYLDACQKYPQAVISVSR